MCKSSRVSLGLVAALTLALLCNVYLLILLWSGGHNDNQHEFMTARPAIVEIRSSIKNVKFGLLNLDYLKSMLNATTRFTRKRSKPLASIIGKIKNELNVRGEQPSYIINKTTSQWVSSAWLIPSFAPELGDVVHYLHSSTIVKASVPHVGTQLKVMITLEGGQKALLKPQWYNRSTVIDGTVYSGADRHNGEIAAFYLSLLLGMRRTPVAVGRRINLSTEILAKADSDLAYVGIG